MVIFCGSMRCRLVGSWPLAGVLFACVFGRAHELAMDFHKHQQSQLFGLHMTTSVEPFDSATALSKEASDENLRKLQPTPSRRKLRVFVRTGTHFICSSFDIIAWIFWRVQAPTDFCPCGIYHTSTSASLSPDSRLHFGKNANPMALHLSGLCVCHHDTPVPNENATLLQPSTSLRPSSPPTRLPCTRQHSCPCAVRLDSELCSRARRGESTLGEM